MIMISRVHAYNETREWMKNEKREKKNIQTTQHLHCRLNLRHRTRQTVFPIEHTKRAGVGFVGIDTPHVGEHSRNTSATCTLNPLSSCPLYSNHSGAFVLPVIIRTSVSKGGKKVSGSEGRTNDKWEHVQRSRIWYREWSVSLLHPCPSVASNLFHLSFLNKRSLLRSSGLLPLNRCLLTLSFVPWFKNEPIFENFFLQISPK